MDMPVKKTEDPEELRAELAIDRDDLDHALETHAELYYHVSKATANAIAQRDEAKLDYEEAEAVAYEALRAKALGTKEHTTETLFKQKLRLDPGLRQLQRRILHLNTKVESWAALKDSFYQRSFMLRELVGWVIAHRYDLAQEHRSTRDRAELIRQRTAEGRRQKRSAG
jgi:hypothetical protein